MFVAALYPGLMLVLFGASVFVAAIFLRRTLHAAATMQPDGAGLVQAQAAAVRIRELDGRLQDYGREIDGRVQSTLTLLDELIAEADTEIEQLQLLVEQQRAGAAATESAESLGIAPKNRLAQHFPPGAGAAGFSAKQKQMIRALRGAGYSIQDIAGLVDATEDDVQAILGEGGHSKAA